LRKRHWRGGGDGGIIPTSIAAVPKRTIARGDPERKGQGTLAEKRSRDAAVSCDQCFFRRRNLCALGRDEPCPTFRPDTPQGLVPPRQPALLARSGDVSPAPAPTLRAAAAAAR